MRDLLRLICLVAALALPAAAQTPTAQTPFAPVAVVNGSPITGFDVEQRVRLLRAIAGVEGDPAGLQRAALDQLIDDRLKLQEARRRGIEPTDEMLTAGLENLAESRGTTAEALRQRIERANISGLALRDLITAEVAWLELVRSRFLPNAGPSATELDAAIDLSTDGAEAAGEVPPEARRQVRQQMLQQRVGRMAEGLLQDLRRDALIEVR